MLRGSEPFHRDGHSSGFTVAEFWRWSDGDLLSNRTRGILAEYLVARSLGSIGAPRKEWDEVDVRTSDGLSVEVKSAAFVQTWHQERPSSIQFGIAPASGWNAETNEYSSEVRRQADVYVFCILGSAASDTVDPIDLDQWRFLVLPTRTLDHARSEQKTITLGSLMRLDPIEVGYEDLGDAIRSAVR